MAETLLPCAAVPRSAPTPGTRRSAARRARRRGRPGSGAACRRRAPRTTSFTVQPNAFLTALASSSGTRAKATERCGLSEPFHGRARCGERHGADGLERVAAILRRRGTIDLTVRPSEPGQRHQLPAPVTPRRSRTARGRSGRARARAPRRVGAAAAASGSRSNRRTMISAPDAPSMAEWWTLATKPMRSCLRPSMTHDLPQRPAAVERRAGDLAGRARPARAGRPAPARRCGGRGSRGRSRGPRSTPGGASWNGTSTSGAGERRDEVAGGCG